jgi:hypothetical protein
VLMSVLKHCPLISLPRFFRFTGGLRWHSDPCKHPPKKNLRVSSSYNAIHGIANHWQFSIFLRRVKSLQQILSAGALPKRRSFSWSKPTLNLFTKP